MQGRRITSSLKHLLENKPDNYLCVTHFCPALYIVKIKNHQCLYFIQFSYHISLLWYFKNLYQFATEKRNTKFLKALGELVFVMSPPWLDSKDRALKGACKTGKLHAKPVYRD